MSEGIWQANNFSCPPNAICAMPFFWGGSQNTLIHKLNIDENNIEYQDSALVPGAPLNQYSMDEHDENFRIITSAWSPERSTGLYILDKNLELTSSLTDLAPGETFRSSRFIGDKLFLVTFEQIDPLFAIDLS
jgi:inhibitor of cysteine peptidase